MNTIKNIRPGILVIPDANLRLRSGQTVEVGRSTKQIDRLIASGHLVRVGGVGKAGEATEAATAAEVASVGQTARGEQIAPPPPSTMSTPSKSTPDTASAAPSDIASAESESRRSVLDALAKKRQEVGSVAE